MLWGKDYSNLGPRCRTLTCEQCQGNPLARHMLSVDDPNFAAPS